MRIAILHYHLRRGGVTRVIEMSCRAMAESNCKVLVLSGEPPASPAPLDAEVRVVPGLAYSSASSPTAAAALRSALEAAARDYFGDLPDIWHLHNHSLAKNLDVPPVVAEWARRGHRLLLHLHDFPEDGRPANYRNLVENLGGGRSEVLRRILYPIADRIRYGALNSRDAQFLIEAGVPTDHVLHLPNPVEPHAASPSPLEVSRLGVERFRLYASRCIRRKNLGEILLLALLGEPGTAIACSLAPENPVARPVYERWKQRASEWRLPVIFELGQRFQVDFEAMVTAAESLITTSIAEGFGLAFLEPWLMNRPLQGRNLPEITADFHRHGIDLAGLYEELTFPVAWLGGVEALRASVAPAMANLHHAYQREAPPHAVDRFLRHVVREGRLDFGRLDEPLQERVLRQMQDDPARRADLTPDRLPPPASSTTIRTNRELIIQHYGPNGYGRRLLAAYRDLMSSDSGRLENLDPSALLDRFLQPERLFLLRT